jgi:formylmethanofuran dehydrogenase subunit B
MTNQTSMNHITCPFCGLACDDVAVQVTAGKIRTVQNACDKSASAFASLDPQADLQPRVGDKPTTLDAAVAAAAKILRGSVQPLFAGLSTDVSGMRAVMQLADRCGAVVDHMNSEAKLRNILVVQDSGWITTTLAEVKNHADLIVFFGGDGVSRFPRLFERVIWNRESMFGLDTSAREIIYLGEAKNTQAGIAPDGRKPQLIRCDNRDLGEVVGALRCLLAGKPLQATHAAGIKIDALKKIAAKLQAAKYGVFCWASADLNFPHAELTIQSLAELIKQLNATTRFAGLPLGGSDADITANAVHTWQSGSAIRTSYVSGKPVYDPLHYSASRMLDNGEADSLLWIATLDETRTPPPTDIPTIVLGRAGMTFSNPPAVFIPVGTPGADHAGHFFRTDKIVALPLRKLRDTLLPSVADVVAALEATFGDGHAD